MIGSLPRLTPVRCLDSVVYVGRSSRSCSVLASMRRSTVSMAEYVKLRCRASAGVMGLVLPSRSEMVGLPSVGLETSMRSTYLNASCAGRYVWLISMVLKPRMICSILRSTKSLYESS